MSPSRHQFTRRARPGVSLVLVPLINIIPLAVNHKETRVLCVSASLYNVPYSADP